MYARRYLKNFETIRYQWQMLFLPPQISEAQPVAERIQKKEFIRRLAGRMQTDEATTTRWLDGVLEEMYETFRSGYGLTLPGFGGFYLDRRRESWAFKFNPGQKLRALFGWSSSYRGPL